MYTHTEHYLYIHYTMLQYNMYHLYIDIYIYLLLNILHIEYIVWKRRSHQPQSMENFILYSVSKYCYIYIRVFYTQTEHSSSRRCQMPRCVDRLGASLSLFSLWQRGIPCVCIYIFFFSHSTSIRKRREVKKTFPSRIDVLRRWSDDLAPSLSLFGFIHFSR